MNLARETYKAESTKYKRSPAEVLGNMAVTGATSYAALLALRFKNPIGKVGNLRYINDFTIGNKPWYTQFGMTPTSSPSLKMQMWNAVKVAEEQLFKIPRAFSLSALIGESVYADMARTMPAIQLTKEMLEKQNLDYLKLISQGRITQQEINAGVTLKNGSLYSNTLGPDGQEVMLLKKAKLVPHFWAKERTDIINTMVQSPSGPQLEKGYAPGIWRAMHEQHSMTPPTTDFLLVGGKSRLGYQAEKANAMMTKATQNFMKLMDDPFELLHEVAEGVPFVDEFLAGKGKRVWERMGMKNLMGVGGYSFLKDGDWKQLFARHAKRGLPLIALGMASYKLVDELMRSTPGIKDTGLGAGISGNVAKVYQDSTKALAMLSQATGLTSLSKKQEELAPGSTSLMGLAALPVSMAIAGATISGVENLVRKAPVGEIVKAGPRLQSIYTGIDSFGRGLKSNLIDAVLDKVNLKSISKTKGYALAGAALGAAAVSIFLPGALGASKTTGELDDIYDGREKVAIRRGRFWEFGTSSFEGGDIEYFGPHWTNRAITDATKKGVYGEYYGRPFTRMLKRIVDPYYLERSMDEERPYTYWGPTDHGLGVFEELFAPVKELFKPTILAHPEALEAAAMGGSGGRPVPGALAGTDAALSTSGIPEAPVSPDSMSLYVRDTANSALNTLGLQGFAFRSIAEKIIGGRGFLSPGMTYETSGRITSAERMYWNSDIGGAGGSSEFYRRLNKKRDYDTEYIQSPLRNKMPEWMPEHLQYGDPYTKVKSGEVRLPGAGYEALYPELEDLDPSMYPAIHKLNILNDVAPQSSEYHKAEREVQDMIQAGELSDSSRQFYDQILKERDAIKNDFKNKFDTGGNALGDYYLALKKFGRSLPTESLYPLSPVHKFMGPVDPLTEYKSTHLLDSQFKLWSNPISDYLKPAFNRTVDMFSMADFVPRETQQKDELGSYFNKLQYAKNKILEEQSNEAAQSGDFESASYFRSGIRPTLYGQNPYGDYDAFASLVPDNQRNVFLGMADTSNQDERERTLAVVPDEWKSILSAKWNERDLEKQRQFDTIASMRKGASPIGGEQNVNELISSDEVPGRDFTGYAPGVDLNAFKVKVASNLGQNIRDHNLWREDERRAVALDMITDDDDMLYSSQKYANTTRVEQTRKLNNYLNSEGIRDARFVATPFMGESFVDLSINNNRNSIDRHKKDKQYSWNS